GKYDLRLRRMTQDLQILSMVAADDDLVEAVGVQVRARHAATNQRWGRVGWATDVYGLASRSLKVRRVVRRVGEQWIIHRAIDAEAQTSRDHEFAEPVS